MQQDVGKQSVKYVPRTQIGISTERDVPDLSFNVTIIYLCSIEIKTK